MGTWGYGPLESDGAAEWMEEAGRPVARQIKRALTKRRLDYDAVRAASLLIQEAFSISILTPDDIAKLVPLAIEALETLSDTEYVQEFDDPAAVQTSLREQVEGLVELHERTQYE